MGFVELHGTKKVIFDKAIELFSNNAYDAVSIKDIADACGLGKSSIFNHYPSKQALLDMMYDYFCEHFFDGRQTLEELKPVIESGSMEDIIYAIFYSFPEVHEGILICIAMIIHQRMFFDERATEIANTIMYLEGIEYAESVFNKVMETRCSAPFDAHALAVLLFNI